MKYHLIFLFIARSVGQCLAQTDTPTLPLVTDQPDGACLRATDEAAWNALRLTTAQLKEVRSTQAAFIQAADLLAEPDSIASEVDGTVLTIHRDRIKAVLTEVQFDKWTSWCIERTMPVKLKE